MKSTSKVSTFSFLLLISSSLLASTGPMVLLSGRPRPWQREVTNQFLKANYLANEVLVKWQGHNPTCKKHVNAILQLCFKSGDFFVVTQKKKVLKRTIAHLVKEGSLEGNDQRPSSRGPLN